MSRDALGPTAIPDEDEALQAIVDGLAEELRAQVNAVTPLKGKH